MKTRETPGISLLYRVGILHRITLPVKEARRAHPAHLSPHSRSAALSLWRCSSSNYSIYRRSSGSDGRSVCNNRTDRHTHRCAAYAAACGVTDTDAYRGTDRYAAADRCSHRKADDYPTTDSSPSADRSTNKGSRASHFAAIGRAYWRDLSGWLTFECDRARGLLASRWC